MSKKLTEKILIKENKKLLNAYTDENGKFFIKETYSISKGGMHYIISKDLKLVRLVSEFAQNLINAGKAILIHKAEWDTFKISAKKKSS
ncbi:MAG: hypothetical protein IJT73_04750 [Selenomonadaceae bacterium]|nr:hypothetical protein [Selenomonadaceae bacterium]